MTTSTNQSAETPASSAQTPHECTCEQTESTPPEHACGCRHKHTPRSEELQIDVQKRLNRVIGQLGGVKAMLDDNRYCGDVLTQLAAAQSALQKISGILLKEHLETCVVEQIQDGHTETIDEVIDLIRKFSR